MRKWTVRLPDDIADTFAAFCATVGVSQQAAVEACVRRVVHRYQENGDTPVEQWAGDDAESMGRYVAMARQLDSERRRGRKGPVQ